MLNNKKFKVILSFVIAVFLWAYVVGYVKPTDTRTVRDITVNIVHSDLLAERGLAVGSVNVSTIDIEVSGNRSVVSSLGAGDIGATADVSSAGVGENEINIVLRVPSGITVTKRSTNKLIVTVEKLISKSVDVDIVYTGTFAEGSEPELIDLSADTVTVSGAESLVNLVDVARGNIDASRVSENESTATAELQPLTSDGVAVFGVSLSQKQVTVRSILSKTKQVKLTVPIKDDSNDGASRKTEVPETVTIKGRADDLASVTVVTADTVDITDITKDTEIALKFSNLPDGIEIAQANSDLVLKLTVDAVSEKTYTFSASEIQLSGKADNLEYTVGDTQVTVTVRGLDSVIGDLKKENVTVTADVSGYTTGAGSMTAPLTAKCSLEVSDISVSPSSITVTVAEQ